MAPSLPLSKASIAATSSGLSSKSNTSALDTTRAGFADFGRGENLRVDCQDVPSEETMGDAPALQRPADKDLSRLLVVLQHVLN